jgi:hypothetical protein
MYTLYHRVCARETRFGAIVETMPRSAPPSLGRHAADDLRFIRDTMARASEFTAVPGWGGVWMGLTALATAPVAGPPVDSRTWLAWWLADAAIAVAIGLVAMTRKIRRLDLALHGAPVRRFALAFLPALAAGAVLTLVFTREHLMTRLPGCWLLLYGAAVTSGGALSVRLVPVMGLVFMLLGVLAFFIPAWWGSFLMAVGFGLVQIGFGVILARNHGG